MVQKANPLVCLLLDICVSWTSLKTFSSDLSLEYHYCQMLFVIWSVLLEQNFDKHFWRF